VRAKLKDLKNLSESNSKKDGTIIDNDTEDPLCTNYWKRKMSDKENSDAWTGTIRVKKSRVSVWILMKSLSYRAVGTGIEFKGHLHQASNL
jgi:hypothetical protein